MIRETIELSTELGADLVDHMGTDLSVVNAARVSFNQKSEELNERDAGLINFLMKNQHTSPFEHCQTSFLITAPIFVAREWHRHRTQSYNEVSGRYTELQPRFYVPNHERPLIQVGKPGAYTFVAAEDDNIGIQLLSDMRFSCQTAWDTYQISLERGIAKEVARMVLPLNIYTSWYATANLLNWCKFINLRTSEQALYEIRMLAYQVRDALKELYPVTMETWEKNYGGQL